ncbi:Uncharacterised protein [uncultured archaeon]|nr:Uncharacterised protein [uncultured archaeon]
MEKNREGHKGWWWIALVILVGIGVWWGLSSENKYEKSCVDSCISEEDYCTLEASNIAQSGTEYLLYDDYQDCFDELESCISLCE